MLFWLPLIASSALAATQTVMVGQGGLKFVPDEVTAAAGDTVTLVYFRSSSSSPDHLLGTDSGMHSASQSTFDAPCVSSGGFNSGIMAAGNSPGQDDMQTLIPTAFTLVLGDDQRHESCLGVL
ncbi:MAG: hypothetical protein TREMPRED_002265 [Tremellales sp. Tagirdzhanova-0007]|nr:MAG: hypothetical protein TREMPRED_002265 [Tremellales sp. Tagirdzhanova-0007]